MNVFFNQIISKLFLEPLNQLNYIKLIFTIKNINSTSKYFFKLKTSIIIWINNLGHPLSFGKWYSHVLLWLVASQLYFWWNPSWKWSPEPCSAHERKLEGPTEDQTLSTEGTWHVFWFSVQWNTGNMGATVN